MRSWVQHSHNGREKATAIEEVTCGVSDEAYRRGFGEVAKEDSHWAADMCPINRGLDSSNPFIVPIN